MEIEIQDRFANVSPLRRLSIQYAKGEISFLDYRHARSTLLHQAAAEKANAIVQLTDIDKALAEIQREKEIPKLTQSPSTPQAVPKPLWFLLFALGGSLVLLGIVLTF